MARRARFASDVAATIREPALPARRARDLQGDLNPMRPPKSPSICESASRARALHTKSERRIRWRADERFAMCSTFKAPLAAAVLSRIDAGEIRRGDVLAFDPQKLLGASRVTLSIWTARISVIEACEAVVAVSDNTAANALLGLIGGPVAMTKFFRSLGDEVTRLDRYEMELNSNLKGEFATRRRRTRCWAVCNHCCWAVRSAKRRAAS